VSNVCVCVCVLICSYKINSTFGEHLEVEVYRRFSDFEWFTQELHAAFPGLVIPVMPEKKIHSASSSSSSASYGSFSASPRAAATPITPHDSTASIMSNATSTTTTTTNTQGTQGTQATSTPGSAQGATDAESAISETRRIQFEKLLRNVVGAHLCEADNLCEHLNLIIFFLTASDEDMKSRNVPTNAQALGGVSRLSSVADLSMNTAHTSHAVDVDTHSANTAAEKWNAHTQKTSNHGTPTPEEPNADQSNNDNDNSSSEQAETPDAVPRGVHASRGLAREQKELTDWVSTQLCVCGCVCARARLYYVRFVFWVAFAS
jgi:hypothetical protein